MADPLPDLAGLVVGIWGFGREGRSMARVAAAAGATRIDAVDDAQLRPLDEPDDIAGLTLYRGADELDRLRHCDVVFVSPGVKWAHPLFAELRDSDVRVSSAADWFVSRHAARTVGVTGTKGKSTTASFLGHLLTTVGTDAVVAGNIGTPLSDIPEGDAVVVAELSSQQAALLSCSPAVAIVTNLYEDHLDWHGDTTSYYLAKANVFRNGAHTVVTTPDTLASFERVGVTDLPAHVLLVDPAAVRLPADDTVMSYEHNSANAALALTAAGALLGRPVTQDEAAAAMRTFQGLPHRLQTVRTTGPAGRSITWIDDTLATTGESVVVALKAMRPDAHVALIVGGMDRHLNYAQLDAYLGSGARRVSLIQAPTNGTAIGRTFAAAHPEHVHPVDSLEQAVRTAAALPAVDVVLLSPGAASYDLFPNYEAKAAAFCDLIDALRGPVGDAH